MQKNKKDRPSKQDTAIINLVGDMKQNIQELISGFNCRCGANSHIRAIFNIYSDKIQKLRMQRDKYKRMCQEMYNYFQTIENKASCQSLSMESTRQPNKLNERPNIFQLLQNELHMPISIQLNKSSTPIDLEIEQSEQILVNSFQPEDSLLITQSSRNRSQGCQKFSYKPPQKISRSFEQFLIQKIQQNHAKFKVNQDMIALDGKRNLIKSSNSTNRKPFANKILQFLN